MERHKPRTASINDFREWDERGELVLAPEFQRREVWTDKAKSFLIDTILSDFPIPALYIRQKIDLRAKKTIREVIDGQQRIRAILDFVNDKFAIMKVHNKRFGGLRFSELQEKEKEKFLEYDLSVGFLVGANDSDVLEVFARINSYTVVLNTQEKLNAEFSGKFKQTVYRLGREHLQFWRNNRILTNHNIVRMKEAELTTDLLIAMIDGIQDRKRKRMYYKDYDDNFPQEEMLTKRFKICIDTIVDIFEDKLIESSFRNSTLFYSLFCAIYDLLYGLPKSKYNIRFKREMKRPVMNAFHKLDEQLNLKEPSKEYFEFKNASSSHTTDQTRRLIRHDTLMREILKEI